VSLTLTRTGGSTGEVEAVYTTTAGTAVANTDYTAKSGGVIWDTGDTTSKTITIPILDAHVTGGGTRSFSVGLTKLTGGATLGTANTATVTISDSDKLVEGQVLSGVSVPGANYGDIGDIYLDTKTGRLYGPKTATGWGAGLSLIGPPGPEGNANINSYQVSPISSDWIYNSQWSFETSPGSYVEYFTRYYTITDANITQDIIDNGFVDVYVNPNPLVDPNQWVPLPYRFLDGSGDFYYFLGYQADVGQITLHYFFEQIVANTTLPTLYNYDIPTYAFKVVYGTGTPTSPAASSAILRPQPAQPPAAGERFRVVKP